MTGGTGFAGSHAIDALLGHGIRVRAIVRATSDLRWIEGKEIETIQTDLDDPAGLRRAAEGCRAVLHFAGLTRARSIDEFHRANAAGTATLAKAFLDVASPARGAVFIYVSSLAAGGAAPLEERHPFPHIRESDPSIPVSPYGRSKLQGERELETIAQRMRTVILRPCAVYGPRDRDILRFFRWVGRGWVPRPAGGRRYLSLIHARDLARASVEALLHEGARGIYYLSDGSCHSWENLGRLAARVMGVRVPRWCPIPLPVLWVAALVAGGMARLGGKPPLIGTGKVRELRQARWVCLPSLAEAEFGFVPRIDVADGMEETVRWYRSVGWLPAAR